jgi:hypothetical protein
MEVVVDGSAHLYYPKIFKLLKKIKDRDLGEFFPENRGQSRKMSLLNPVWKSLESWSLLHDKGKFKDYKNDTYQKYVGKARINAILSYTDRTNIYRNLPRDFDKDYLPSILDIAPVIQRFVRKHAHVFSSYEIYQESGKTDSNNKFIRDAIYNIVMSDLKNEFIRTNHSNPNDQVKKIIGIFRSEQFPNLSKVAHTTQDNKRINKIEKRKEILSKWLHGGKINYNDKDYEVIKGRLKKFTKNQKSLEILGHPFIQVNRVIEDTGKYVFGVYRHNDQFHKFEEWVEKHNYEIKEVDENIGLDWKFYEVENPNHNLKEYHIVIDRNSQQELHFHNPTINLKDGLKIHPETYLGGFEPNIILENFNFYKKNEQFDLTITRSHPDGNESEINDYSLNMFEGFCELDINYVSSDDSYTINIKLDILDKAEDNETEMTNIEEKFTIQPPYITQSLWAKSFNFEAFNVPEIENAIKKKNSEEFFLNIFDNPSLEINNENFKQIEPLLIKKEYLNAEYLPVTLEQLRFLLEKIYDQQRLFSEDEENIINLIKLIHLMQVFSFIFKKFRHDSEIQNDKELIENIFKNLDSRWPEYVTETPLTVEQLLFDIQSLYAPFILWSIMIEKVLHNHHNLSHYGIIMR